jgi:4-amino-4-deoxy-L-arabinose transferase-like glycosyltransferase
MLAGIYSVFGFNELYGHITLAVTGSLGSVMVYVLGTILFSRRIGVIGGILSSVYPFFVILSIIPLTESLAIFFYPTIAVCMVNLLRHRGYRIAIVCGVVLGLASLNKPTALLFVFVFPLYIILRKGNFLERVKIAFTIFVSAWVVISPWAIRNIRVWGKFIPVSPRGCLVLYQGNSQYTEYSIRMLEEGKAIGWLKPPDFRGFRKYSDFCKHAVLFMIENPKKTVEFAFRKFLIFLRHYPHPMNIISWYPIFLFSIIGMFMTRCRELLPVYILVAGTAIIPFVFTSMPRFRTPIEPFLIIFASCTIDKILEYFRHVRK